VARWEVVTSRPDVTMLGRCVGEGRGEGTTHFDCRFAFALPFPFPLASVAFAAVEVHADRGCVSGGLCTPGLVSMSRIGRGK
jgi:hypothetical protein